MAVETPSGWTNDGTALVRAFDRSSFNGAIAFVNEVAHAANALDHHPDITVSWKRVTIRTWSHDVGTVTQRDVALALAINALAADPGP
jgi:4a-hydroxytetrahydrobiopterin dehydratase